MKKDLVFHVAASRLRIAQSVLPHNPLGERAAPTEQRVRAVIRAIGRLTVRACAALVLIICAALSLPDRAGAAAIYWNLFNDEGGSVLNAGFVTYATLSDMLADTNRTGTSIPSGGGAGVNVVGGDSNGTVFWNLFNDEGGSVLNAGFVTYATLSDMLADTNRTGTSIPNGGGAAVNIVGSGSDGTTYWNLFNDEGGSVLNAGFVTYATLSDMLADTNRTGTSIPNGGGAAVNIVGTGSDGTTYWNLFNDEGGSVLNAGFVTYATLSDMLADTNRTGTSIPNGGGAAVNIVGTGATITATNAVPEPGAIALLSIGLLMPLFGFRRRSAATI